MKSAIVLGAGMVGVATAVHLQKRGWSVALVDRKEPGRETSYGNAGIIQSEALKPYPMPHDWLSLTRIAMGRTNDVRYNLAALPHHAGPLLRYWWNSLPGRHRKISAAYARIPPLGWLMFVELPVEEAYAPLYEAIERSLLLLLGALVRAVKQWKYEPGPKDTEVEVKAAFNR